MRKLWKLLGAGTAISVALFLGACSDDSSNTTGTGVDHGEISVPIPDTETDASSASEETSSATEKPSSSSDATSSETKPASSSVKETSSASKETSSASEPPSSSATSSSSTAEVVAKSWRENCLDTINAYRATENVAPLTLAADSLQACTDKQAAADMESGKAHGHFGDCHEGAQNTGPNINTSWQGTDTTKIAYYYAKMMWEDEKKLVTSGERDPNKDEDYSYIGHYLNMRNPRYTKVACGFAVSSDGKKAWLNMNFYSR